MRRMSPEELYRCDLCHGSVDADTRDRARKAWQPLIICEPCVRGADSRPISGGRTNFAVAR